MRIHGPFTFSTLAAGVVLLASACDAPVEPGANAALSAANAVADRSGPAVLNITAEHHTLVTSAHRVASGWTTIRFQNRGDAPHFVVLERLPCVGDPVSCDQKTVEDSKAEIVPVFQNFMDAINGSAPTFPAAGFTLPDWFADIDYLGGPGLVSPGRTAVTTLDLRPGTYAMECYVKTEDGLFHSADGMIEGLVVTDASNASPSPPLTAMIVTISSVDGITLQGKPPLPGTRTFAVHFDDQSVYGNLLGHDAHLVRLDADADPAALDAWMNWAVPGGLAEPGPAGVVFLGGTEEMPGGSTAYVTARLASGTYAWIAEVDDPVARGLYATFTVK